jgi:Putative addiction module component
VIDPIERIYEAALELPREARSELAAMLADSAEEGSEGIETIEAAWVAEAKRRLAQVDAGEAELFEIEDVEAELLETIARARARVRAGDEAE